MITTVLAVVFTTLGELGVLGTQFASFIGKQQAQYKLCAFLFLLVDSLLKCQLYFKKKLLKQWHSQSQSS